MADDTFGLACPTCGHIFPGDVTVGVLAAHMEVLHEDTGDEVHVEMVVLCPRCHKAMDLVRSEPTATGQRHHYDCKPCHRTRTVNQGTPGTDDTTDGGRR